MPVPMFGSNPTFNSIVVNNVFTLTGGADRLPDHPCTEILVQQDPANANLIYVGGPNLSTANGFVLGAPAAGTTPVAYEDFVQNTNEVYVSGTAGQFVRFGYRTT